MANPLNQLGGLGSLLGGPGAQSGLGQRLSNAQAQSQQFGRWAEQQMHAAQQQMDIERARLEHEMRLLTAMPPPVVVQNDAELKISSPRDHVGNEIYFEPDIERLPIREYLQRRVDAWLAPVTL